MILLLVMLTLKHFIFDFYYQPPYQWQNKGIYGHWGGLVHSGQHAAASVVILLALGFAVPLTLAVVVSEFIIHYHMDWFKMNYNKKKGWTATTHNEFWVLLGVDQLVHSLTYIGMVYVLLGG